MLAIFAVIIGGIVTGRLLVGWRLALRTTSHHLHYLGAVVPAGRRGRFRSGGRRLSGDARGGRLCDLRAVRCGERLRCVVAVAAYSRPRRVCGRRRRCGRSSRFRVDGPERESGDRRLFRRGVRRGAFRAVRHDRFAHERLCALRADVLRRRDAGQRPHPRGAGPAARSAGWRCCPSPRP